MIRYDGQDVMPGVKLSHNAGIHELIFEEASEYENGDRLFGVWITTAVYDSDNNYLGHTYTMPYIAANDPDGEDALFYGGGLYDDGMRLTDPAYAEARIECFKAAANAGISEAFYKLGDCHKNGIGCDIDERKAFLSYEQAAKHDEGKEAYLTGSIALRIAGCYEEGSGCEHNFKQALEQYEMAEKYLDAAVVAGDFYYKGALRKARDGAIRCRQELSFMR